MAKTNQQISVTMVHYGEYEKWQRGSKALPKIKTICHEIVAEIDTEFGYTLNIKGHKGENLSFIINHPPFLDKNKEITPSFTGDLIIPSNNYNFYLGDCIWEPLHDKLGEWELITFIENSLVAQKSLQLINSKDFDFDW